MPKEKKLIPELRFPEFKNEGEWEVDIVDNLVSTITPPRKLTSSDYQKDGKFPIIDQSKSFYCGWTNDVDAVIKDDLPLIIFGDHTCILKITNKPFVQGADGIKILKTKNKVIPEFLYQYLQYNEVKQEDYKRHFSILKEKSVLFPKKESGEQQKIASCLSSLDDLISTHSQKLDLLKDHKKGLMQNLFPQEGEKVPKYRFKEFEKDVEWMEKTLEEIAEVNPASSQLPDEFVYIDLESVENGVLLKRKIIQKEGSPSRAQRLLKNNDVIFQMVRPYQKNNYYFNRNDDLEYVASTGYAQLRAFESSMYLYQLIHTDKFVSKVSDKCTGSNYPAINSSDLSKITVQIPRLKEQQKIASCLSSLDALIKAQEEIIEQLKQHKKGLMQGLFPKMN